MLRIAFFDSQIYTAAASRFLCLKVPRTFIDLTGRITQSPLFFPDALSLANLIRAGREGKEIGKRPSFAHTGFGGREKGTGCWIITI